MDPPGREVVRTKNVEMYGLGLIHVGPGTGAQQVKKAPFASCHRHQDSGRILRRGSFHFHRRRRQIEEYRVLPRCL
ncbi:unnamed protein product [Urochloa humidicola]